MSIVSLFCEVDDFFPSMKSISQNGKSRKTPVSDVVLLKKRILIELVIKELKSQTQLEHTRHRSFENFQVNVISTLIAYTYLEKKPSLNLRESEALNDLFPVPWNFYNFFQTHVKLAIFMETICFISASFIYFVVIYDIIIFIFLIIKN